MEENHQKVSPWRKPMIIGGVFGLVLICIVAAALSRTDLSAASREYEKNRADAAKEGLYFSREQVEARYQIPESENGARLISSVLPLLGKLKLDRGTVLTAEMIKTKWSELEPAIATIEEASHRKHLMFRRDFSNPAATLFPEYSRLKDWVKLLVQLGHISAEKGDLSNAEKYWSLATYLTIKTDEEGMLIGILVRISCAAILERELQTMVASLGRDPKMLQVLESVLSKLDQPYDMKMPLRLENWFAISVIDAVIKDSNGLQDLGFGNSLPNEIKYGRYLPGFRKANLSRIYRTYADAIHLIPDDPYDMAGVQRAYESLDRAGMKQGLSYTMQSIMMPVFSQTTLSVSRDIAQRNALIQAVALLKSGADPAKGLPLKGRHAKDLDGKSIRLKKNSSGWIVYSIGRDNVDDGGIPVDTHGKGDYVVRLPK
ncbi:MAG: hypothetical protein WCI55_01470 [Armatimonadota bacterium]